MGGYDINIHIQQQGEIIEWGPRHHHIQLQANMQIRTRKAAPSPRLWYSGGFPLFMLTSYTYLSAHHLGDALVVDCNFHMVPFGVRPDLQLCFVDVKLLLWRMRGASLVVVSLARPLYPECFIFLKSKRKKPYCVQGCGDPPDAYMHRISSPTQHKLLHIRLCASLSTGLSTETVELSN